MAGRDYRSPVREKHAEDTRRAIVEAAGTLFAERGYAGTSVAAIAEAAGVAVNTVYTSVGGKRALITALAEDGARDEAAADAMDVIAASTDPREILRVVAETTGHLRIRRRQLLSILLDNRTAHPDVAAAADLATRAVRARLGTAAARLITVGGLRPGLTRARVEQTLWFYFGFDAWRTVRDFGWKQAEAAQWLTAQAEHALLGG